LFVTSDTGETDQLRANLATQLAIMPNVYIVRIGDILVRAGASQAEADAWVYTGRKRVHKWPYQGIKKLYGSMYFNCSQSLIMDSEILALKPMSFQEMFDDYWRRPLVFYSTHTDTAWPAMGFLQEASYSLMKVGSHLFPKNTWLFEYQGWFINITVLYDFFCVHSEDSRPAVLFCLRGFSTGLRNDQLLHLHMDAC